MSKKLDDPRDMTPEQLSIALINASTLELWIRSVRAYAFDELRAGRKIPGFALGYGVRHRVWRINSEAILVSALEELGIPKKELYTKPELKSPAQVEIVLKEHKKWPAKPRGKDRPPTPIDGLVEKSMPEQKVVRVEDTGNANQMADAEEEFR